MQRIPTHKRLRELPEVFTTRTLAAHLGGDARLASVYINRWKADGFIDSIGPRAGLHFNLLRNPDAATEMRMEALAYLFPGAMVAGVSAVHAAGWTTQIPAEMEVMVPSRRSFPAIDGVALDSRPRSWFTLARQHVQRPGLVPMVAPDFALADLWVRGSWRPDVDDLEWDMIDGVTLEAAFHQLDALMPEAWRAELEAEQMSLGL